MSTSASAKPSRPPIITAFFDNPASSGIVLMVAAALALIVANSPLAGAYADGLHAYLGSLSVQHWINDGLMAGFFLLVGLEIKREMAEGELSNWASRVLPGCAAIGGMIGPALIYLAINSGQGGHPSGWAIPAATDIAFALGVLSLLGPRVPASLRVFLTALAIIDDLGAVIIIALFYTTSINVLALGGAAAVLVALAALNRFGVVRLWPYLLLGVVLWVLVLQSGVHATLAGVALAMAIPLRGKTEGVNAGRSPLHALEHAIQPWVAFVVVPIFGFANAGVSFASMSPGQVLDPVPLGIAAGLLFGKQIGVFGAAALVIRAGWARLPAGASWRQVYGIALLCGIGFTMSLFISPLAFPGEQGLQDEAKLGVLLGSVLSAIAGAIVLRAATANRQD